MFERITAALPQRARRALTSLGQEPQGDASSSAPGAVTDGQWAKAEPAGKPGALDAPAGHVKVRLPALFVVQDEAALGDN